VLAETQVTDMGLKELKGLTKLQELVVAKTKVRTWASRNSRRSFQT
jgi:hypothetical protein